MKTTFKINDENFTEHLRLTYGDKSVCFSEKVTIEYEPCDELEVSVEQIGAFEYARYKIKNPILRGIVWALLLLLGSVFFFLLYLLLAFLHGYEQIRVENEEFESQCPFYYKSRFKIPNPDGKIIELKYTDSRFNKSELTYSKPSLTAYNDDVSLLDSTVVFNQDKLKNELLAYWVPFLFTTFLMVSFLEFVTISACFRNTYQHGFIDYLIAIALIVFFIVVYFFIVVKVLKSFKKCKLIAQNQMETE